MTALIRLSLAAALLLAAMPAGARLPAAITDRSDPAERALNCAAYLGHEINAVRRLLPPPRPGAQPARGTHD